MLGHIATSGLIGLLFGFGWSPAPRMYRELSFAVKFAVAFVVALLVGYVISTLGVNTAGIDWVALIVGALVSYLVAWAAVVVVARTRHGDGRT